MNSLKDLTAGVGCSTDGTAATANPLTGLVNQAMGMGQKGMPHPSTGMVGPRGVPLNQQSEIERAMSAGMGLSRGGDMRSPFERAAGGGGFQQQQQQFQSPFDRPVQENAFAREFQQQFRGAPTANNNLLGPRGHVVEQGGWVNDFQRMNIRGDVFNAPPSARAMNWRQEMARGPPPMEMERAWRERNQMQGNQWANEMAKQQQEEEEIDLSSVDMEATRKATEDMVRVLADNPKFRNSEFFDFMSKVSTGELKFENNEVVPGNPIERDPLAAAWEATEKNAGATEGGLEDVFSRAWKDGEYNEEELNKVFQDLMAQNNQNFDYESMWENQSYNFPEQMNSSPLETPYELETNNPYAASPNAFEDGMKFFNAGMLQQAVLAFQAVVAKEPAHSEAWRMLGVVHQENDEDKKAIQCLERAVEYDAYNLDALLGLGVSYVNEINETNALKNLKAWVINNPAFVGLEVQKDEYSDGSMMDEVMQLMLKAAEWAPKDPGVQEVLGVLFNVTRDYSAASVAFRKAVDARPDDYALWNKCGATLANSTPSRSEEAIPLYLRAIELRPGYARAHLNLGISYNNLGNYDSSARAYIRALELSPTALHIWQYLKISLTCLERPDLIALCEARDLQALKRHF